MLSVLTVTENELLNGLVIMCLSKIFRTFESNTKEVKAWKVFNSVYEGIVYSELMGHNYPQREWTKSWDSIGLSQLQTIVADDNCDYQTGFHAYIYWWSAAEHIGLLRLIRGKWPKRVILRDVRTRGWQSGRVVLVAKEIFVP